MTIASVDAINMYSSIKITTIKNAVRFFARKFNAATKKSINLCIEFIQFWVSSILISFNRKYYEYHSGKREEQGLAIGGYESAFLVNLVASYLFEEAKTLLNQTTYHGIYQDGGMVVLKGKKIVKGI